MVHETFCSCRSRTGGRMQQGGRQTRWGRPVTQRHCDERALSRDGSYQVTHGPAALWCSRAASALGGNYLVAFQLHLSRVKQRAAAPTWDEPHAQTSRCRMLLLAFVGGVLTILSPCILPVIPLVFAARGRAFRRETIPMLIGLAAAFAASAAVGASAAHWLASAAAIGRIVAIVVVGLVGATLLMPQLSQRLIQPVVNLGASLSSRAVPSGAVRGSVTGRVMLGAAIGMLWAPCAGPILALLVAGTAR